MRTDQDSGNVIIKFSDGNEIHIIPPEWPEFDHDGGIREAVLNLVTSEIGNVIKTDEYTFEENQTVGTYYVDGKSYTSDHYQLDIIQDEFYFGASSGSEQIILALYSGIASGIISVITAKIFDIVSRNAKEEYGDNVREQIFDESQRIRIERILIKRFKAEMPVNYMEINEGNDEFECILTDAAGNVYSVKACSKNGVLSLDFKKNV